MGLPQFLLVEHGGGGGLERSKIGLGVFLAKSKKLSFAINYFGIMFEGCPEFF